MMGEHCGERGKEPGLERMEHLDASCTVPFPGQELLMQLRRYARVLYVATYTDPTPTDAQRLLRQVIPGSQLVLAELSDSHEVPSYFLTCTRQDRKAYLILPGTRNSSDVVTDVNAEAEEVPGGLAHRGMVRSAQWLVGEVGPVLVFLYTKGYQITVIGHSLGAAVASLFTHLLRPQIDTLKAFCYGTPSCVDEQLMGVVLDCVVSVVNRDDVVPRLTVQSVQALTQSALCPGQRAKTKAWMDEDWKALKDVERILELRRRGGGAAAATALPPAGPSPTSQEEEPPAQTAAEPARKSSSSWGLGGGSVDVWGGLQRLGTNMSSAWASGSSKAEDPSGAGGSSCAAAAPQEVAASSTFGFKLVDAKATNEDPLPRFFIPGQVVHLYQQDGLSRAALAPCTHEALTRIHPTPDMLDDHRVKAYDEALRQACIRKPCTPKWESFEQRKVCACCEADFNWAYILKSEPQQLLARNHCYSCGRVVCDGCSQNRIAHQQLGLLLPVRTCDSCFFSPEKDH